MGKESKIEWTDHTFNPWIGCTKVSQECKNCYAETLANRYFKDEKLWGPDSWRHVTSDTNWKQPIKWNKHAAEAGKKAFVFCASLADWAEDRDELKLPRMRLFDLIRATPNLIWLLLTKRYENSITLLHAIGDQMPGNIMLGFTTGTQETLHAAYAVIGQAKKLGRMPKVRLFLSCEPLLNDISTSLDVWSKILKPDWVIAGGESGPHARPMHPVWLRLLRDVCVKHSIPFLFKQWGEWLPEGQETNFIPGSQVREVRNILTDGSEYTTGFINAGDLACMKKVGKKAAGRQVDGREWNQMPGDNIELEDPDLYHSPE